MDSYEGDFAANLVTAPFGFVQYSTVGVLVNGEATFSYGGGGGGANVDHASGGGTPLSFKPTALNGYYKATTLTPGDLPFAKVLLTKYDSILHQRDTVSYSEFNFTTNENFTPFSIPLVDLMEGVIPDTITTIFYSSNPATVNEFDVWSNLYLDSISLSPSNPTDIDINSSLNAELNVFPNPTSGEFRIENITHSITQIEIYNQIGMKVKSINLQPDRTLSIDMSSYPAGMYYVKTDQPGLSTKKLILVK